MKTINEINPSKEELLSIDYKFQAILTEKLDKIDSDFDQEIINEIILWKVNRYAKVNSHVLGLINKIDKQSKDLDYALTGEILMELLSIKGIRLPMASTILRFKNPHIYQIIDQRVYRIIYGKKLKLKTNLNENIIQYTEYLSRLQEVCSQFEIPFSDSDRILYEFDKSYNREKIDY